MTIVIINLRYQNIKIFKKYIHNIFNQSLKPSIIHIFYSDDRILKAMPDYALLLAWNFSKEIVSNNIQYLKKGGKFIIPIPKIKIISYKEK